MTILREGVASAFRGTVGIGGAFEEYVLTR